MLRPKRSCRRLADRLPVGGSEVTVTGQGLTPDNCRSGSVWRHVAALEAGGFITRTNNGCHFESGRPIQRPNSYKVHTVAERQAKLLEREVEAARLPQRSRS